jgi:hypothetical protein
MFTRCINQKMKMLGKVVLQFFALSMKARKTAKGVSKRKGNEVQRVILANNVEWQARFEE